MNNFLFGFLLGSSDNDSGGSNDKSGCGCLIVAIVILYLVFHFTAKLFGLTDYGLFKNILGLIGFLFYPSAWDFYHDVAVGSIGWKFWISAGNLLSLIVVCGLVLGLLDTLISKLSSKNILDTFLGKLLFGLIMMNGMVSIIRCIYYAIKFIF